MPGEDEALTGRRLEWPDGAASGARHPSRSTPRSSATIGHALVDDLAALFEALESPSELPLANDETPADVAGGARRRRVFPSTARRPESSSARRATCSSRTPPRSAIRASGVRLRLAGADRRARRPARAGGQPERRRAGTLAPMPPPRSRRQTVRWLAELIGYPAGCGGLLVSGGNMANFVGFLAARRAQGAGGTCAQAGTGAGGLGRVYCSAETHTWVAEGRRSLRHRHRRDPLDRPRTREQRHRHVDALRDGDRRRPRGRRRTLPRRRHRAAPSSTGAVDPLPELAAICREEELWFHVDGAYGGFAALPADAPDGPARRCAQADSVAIDPHKWLYVPVEAGCALVRDARGAAATRSPTGRPTTTSTRGAAVELLRAGPQNSRGFRALKVWLALRQAGRAATSMIGEDCRLARASSTTLRRRATRSSRPTQGLSIATFRYVPEARPREARSSTRLNERAARAAAARRRGVHLERGHRRPLLPARLHRQLPHDRRRRARAARDREAPRGRGAAGCAAGGLRSAGKPPGSADPFHWSLRGQTRCPAARCDTRSCAACRPSRRGGSRRRSPRARRGTPSARPRAAAGSGR